MAKPTTFNAGGGQSAFGRAGGSGGGLGKPSFAGRPTTGPSTGTVAQGAGGGGVGGGIGMRRGGAVPGKKKKKK